MTQEKITPEELKSITDAMARREKLATESRIAALEHQSLVQHIFIKYGLTFDDQIDDATGNINRKRIVVQEAGAAPEAVDTSEVG